MNSLFDQLTLVNDQHVFLDGARTRKLKKEQLGGGKKKKKLKEKNRRRKGEETEDRDLFV